MFEAGALQTQGRVMGGCLRGAGKSKGTDHCLGLVVTWPSIARTTYFSKTFGSWDFFFIKQNKTKKSLKKKLASQMLNTA